MISPRVPRHEQVNALTRALADLRARGTAVMDLTASNPTTAGLAYPDDLLTPLSDARGLRYEPHPFGLPSAREAVARDFLRRGAEVDPSHVVLSASTSEAYAWVFKLLCAAGESVLVPRPSYPLFEHLTRLEAVRAVPYDLEYHGRWEIDLDTVRAAPADTRALVVVSPNNPTGSYLMRQELDALASVCRERGWALVVDEVFADYPLEVDDPPLTDLALRAGVLSFTLGGASKTIGLPQLKLGWIVVGGPSAQVADAQSALEVIADAFLSVGTPVQIAAGELLRRGSAVRRAIHERIRNNLVRAREVAARYRACTVLRAEGGWSAVVRIPDTHGEEATVLDLLAREHVLVHPGYFFDMPREAYLVVSLLPPEHVFADAFERTLRLANS